MTPDVLVEVCCGSVDDAIQAQIGGARRVELNCSLFHGGLTPSAGAIIQTKKHVDIPVMAMVRPRGGGFCYTQAEMSVMLSDTESAIANGADGIVFGILTEDGRIDVPRCRQILDILGKTPAVFHRAFDVTPDPFEALEQLIDLGFKRILTSGQAPTVPEGIQLIAELINRAKTQIEILPGGGIRPRNVKMIVEHTGTTQVHLGAFKPQLDTSVANRPNIRFGGSLSPPEDRYDLIDKKMIGLICKNISP